MYLSSYLDCLHGIKTFFHLDTYPQPTGFMCRSGFLFFCVCFGFVCLYTFSNWLRCQIKPATNSTRHRKPSGCVFLVCDQVEVYAVVEKMGLYGNESVTSSSSTTTTTHAAPTITKVLINWQVKKSCASHSRLFDFKMSSRKQSEMSVLLTEFDTCMSPAYPMKAPLV